MAKYVLQGKKDNGDVVDIPLVATYDSNGQNIAEQLSTKYTKPSAGIPESDLASGVQNVLEFANIERKKSLNLLDFSTLVISSQTNGTVSINYENNTITYSGTSGDNYAYIKKNLQLKPNTTYTLSLSATKAYEIFVFDTGANTILKNSNNSAATFTTLSNGLVNLRIDNEGGANSNNVISEIMLVEGDEACPYEPYYGDVVREKALQSNLETSLYNRGACDIYKSNGDDTATIKRKTGYINSYDLNIDHNQGGSMSSWGFATLKLPPKTANYPKLFLSNKEDYVISSNVWASAAQPYWQITIYNGELGIRPANASLAASTDYAAIRNYIAQHPFLIQYEVADDVATDDLVIDKQTINILTQDEILRLKVMLQQSATNAVVYSDEVPLYTSTNSTSPAELFGGDWESRGSYETDDGTEVYVWEEIK